VLSADIVSMSSLAAPEDLLLYYEGTSELNPPRPFTPTKVLYQHAGDGVFLITLNDEKSLNSMSNDLSRHLGIVIEHARRDERCKVVVWTGAGRAFCSGGNFGAAKTSISDEVWAGYRHFGCAVSDPDIAMAGNTRMMIKFAKISISAVNGIAIGGGVNLAWIWQDFCYASQEATFQFPFPDLGLTPELGSSVILAKMIGLPRAKMLLQMGKKITAEEAQAWGLVTEVVPTAEVVERALAAARKLASQPQFALQQNKRLVNAELIKSIDQITEDENETIRAAFQDSETQQRLAALMARTSGKAKPKSKL